MGFEGEMLIHKSNKKFAGVNTSQNGIPNLKAVTFKKVFPGPMK